ncbi:hypothetical protein PFMALIP_00390 [Plasmodium falciparum MaliPS096_E11]|uniref:Surface antigen n=1 Tax=Plasmodium falciparum MaliPS096_E11 TaxID=1036727 RepID=A0A024WWI9_PLAFA|nr:hypothetical protein PFMALIP_00390 [Plasmodium falciparum MaliPS096_E11]
MIFYIIKLISFSTILGTLILNYNNECGGLYKDIKHKNILLVPTTFRSLRELSYQPIINHKRENNELREYNKNNETNYKKIKYRNDDVETKQNISEVTEKDNSATINLQKCRKRIYYNENEEKSNKSSRSLKYLEMQRKLYNNFYIKPEMDFQNFSDKTNNKNDKSCECTNNMKSYNHLSSLNKVHDKYLDNLKTCCVGGARACTLSSALTGISAAFIKALSTMVVTGTSHNSVASIGFIYCGIAALVLFLIAVVLIILYIWILNRRKNSWKYKYKKHLCT